MVGLPFKLVKMQRFIAQELGFFLDASAFQMCHAGPGKAWSAKEQGEYLFKLAGKKPWLIGVPVALMDGIISIFDGLTKIFPNLEVDCSASPPTHDSNAVKPQ